MTPKFRILPLNRMMRSLLFGFETVKFVVFSLGSRIGLLLGFACLPSAGGVDACIAVLFAIYVYVLAWHGLLWCLGRHSRGGGGGGWGGKTDFSLQSAPVVRAPGCQVLSQLLASTWWDWDAGSSLVFWRWNGLDQQTDAWFGTPIHVSGALPSYHRKQRPPSDDLLTQVGGKLSTVLSRGNFDVDAPIESMSDYFAVPKGECDIRMVYNGTSCGLNASLWAPNFWLQSSESALRFLTCDSYCGDMD